MLCLHNYHFFFGKGSGLRSYGTKSPPIFLSLDKQNLIKLHKVRKQINNGAFCLNPQQGHVTNMLNKVLIIYSICMCGQF